MELKECIYGRRSVRKFNQDKPIEEVLLQDIVKAGVMAPSAKNTQPWKFKIVTKSEDIESIARQSLYYRWLRKSSAYIVVFLDKKESFEYLKDVQGIGAAVQTMLLYAHSIGVGTCWVGEIVKKNDEVKEILGICNDNLQLMALIACGTAMDDTPLTYTRKSIQDVLI